MRADEVYDWLLTRGVAEPAVLHLGELWVVGSWSQLPTATAHEAMNVKATVRRKRLLIGSGKERQIYVYGEGLTVRLAWEDARNRVSFRDMSNGKRS